MRRLIKELKIMGVRGLPFDNEFVEAVANLAAAHNGNMANAVDGKWRAQHPPRLAETVMQGRIELLKAIA